MAYWKTVCFVIVSGVVLSAFSNIDKGRSGLQASSAVATPSAASAASPLSVRGAASTDQKTLNIVGNILSREYLKYLDGNDALAKRFEINFPKPLPINAYALFQSSQLNIATTDREFGGKHLLITGHVLSIHPGRRPSEYIVSLPGGFAVFDEDTDFVSRLQAGREAKFVCTYAPGLALNGYGLDGCRSITRFADSVAMMVVLQPTMVGSDGAKALQAMRRHAQKSSEEITGACASKIDVRACFGLELDQGPASDSLEDMREALKALPAASQPASPTND